MDYEIAYNEEEQGYRVQMEYEFSVIGDWISEQLTNKTHIMHVLNLIKQVQSMERSQHLIQGNFEIQLKPEGAFVSRKVDMSDAREEIIAMFDTQSDFYQTSTEGIQAECGLDDLIDIIENWQDMLQ
jgi:uncharacterized protein